MWRVAQNNWCPQCIGRSRLGSVCRVRHAFFDEPLETFLQCSRSHVIVHTSFTDGPRRHRRRHTEHEHHNGASAVCSQGWALYCGEDWMWGWLDTFIVLTALWDIVAWLFGFSLANL